MGLSHENHRDQPEWQGRVDAVLVSLARGRQCITYADLADVADIPAPKRIHKLTQHLEALVRRDAGNNAPLLAAVVVSKRDAGLASRGLPGRGFFECCEAHGVRPEASESLEGWHGRLLAGVFAAFADDETDDIASLP